MNRKDKNIQKLKQSTLFPGEYLEIYEEDYDNLTKEEEEKIKDKILKLQNSKFKIDEIKNAILSKFNSQFYHIAI